MAKSLKIQRKKKRSQKVAKKKIRIKAAKMNKTSRKIRSLTTKAIKTAIKGIKLAKVPNKLYRRIDSAVAKADLITIITKAVVDEVNAIVEKKKPAKSEPETEATT